MPNGIHATWRRATRRLAALPLILAASLSLLPSALASADPAVPVTPFLDCVSFNGNPTNPVYTAYFGYNNTGPVQFNLAIGGDNAVVPGAIDGGQPTAFNVGNYPRVFPLQFDGQFLPSITWELNGVTVQANVDSATCSAGVTAPASDVGSTSATLNGVVSTDGQDTSYRFEYGTTPSLGTPTPTKDAGSGAQAHLVQGALTDLTPSTQYYFQLETTNALSGTTHGQQQTFTTSASGIPTSVAPASGTDQTTTVGDTFAVPLQVKVVDAQGAPVPNTAVTFTAPTTGASATFPGGTNTVAVPTDSTGLATAPTLTADQTSGSFSIAATVPGVASHATFPLTNAPQPDRRAATKTLLTASANPAVAHRAVNYTATVLVQTPGMGTPTGTVAFTDNGAPLACLRGTRTLDRSGQTTCTVTYGHPGRHLITATYGGTSQFLPTTSQPLIEVITQPH